MNLDFLSSTEAQPLDVPFKISKYSLICSFIQQKVLSHDTGPRTTGPAGDSETLGKGGRHRGSPENPLRAPRGPRQGIVNPVFGVRENFTDEGPSGFPLSLNPRQCLI